MTSQPSKVQPSRPSVQAKGWSRGSEKRTVDISEQSNAAVAIYECEVNLKFRLLENSDAMIDRNDLLELLLDAFMAGSDEYLEPIYVNVQAQEVPEVQASPQMRRQLIRLNNLRD